MELLGQQIAAGVSTGAIYACVALALVMIYLSIGHVNFAQGEMATFSTFLAWQLLQWGMPYWLSFVCAIAASFALGVLIDQTIFKRVRRASLLTQIVMFVGLLSVFNSTAGFIWDFTSKPFPSPFGADPFLGLRLISTHQAAMIVIVFLLLAALYVFFRFTSIGLAMQSAAENPISARLVGIRVERMISLGWGLAASIGAVAGLLIAPIIFLEPNMMVGILVYGFAGAVVGGLSSPIGAIVGGFSVGIIENLAGTYIPVFGPEMKLTIALLIIVSVLVFKPTGLFGRPDLQRV